VADRVVRIRLNSFSISASWCHLLNTSSNIFPIQINRLCSQMFVYCGTSILTKPVLLGCTCACVGHCQRITFVVVPEAYLITFQSDDPKIDILAVDAEMHACGWHGTQCVHPVAIHLFIDGSHDPTVAAAYCADLAVAVKKAARGELERPATTTNVLGVLHCIPEIRCRKKERERKRNGGQQRCCTAHWIRSLRFAVVLSFEPRFGRLSSSPAPPTTRPSCECRLGR
jgi:hypothetical protein